MQLDVSKKLQDAFTDLEFKEYFLTDQEASLLSTIANEKYNESVISSYKNYVGSILSKYLVWETSTSIGLARLQKESQVIEKRLEEQSENIKNIEKLSTITTGAHALTAYAKIFSDKSKTHSENAKTQIKYYFIQWQYPV